MKFMPFAAASGSLALVLGGIAVFAQDGTPEPAPPVPAVGKTHLWSEVGSFQLEGTGTAKVKFIGTLLVVKSPDAPMPEISIRGNVRKEFESAEMGRVAWFGTGEATITGSWRHVSVFGEKIDGVWTGSGIASVFGEFDREGHTGYITVDGSEPFEWLATGLTFYVPANSDPRIAQNRQNPPPTGDTGKAVPVPKPGG